MRRFILLLVVLTSFSIVLRAADADAWKNEKSLERQYSVFKENLNFWNGNYFLKETQLNEFYTALSDSVAVLKVEITNKAGKINNLQNQLVSASQRLENTRAELETSIKNQHSIQVFGINIRKGVYTLLMSAIILGLFVFTSIVYHHYKRSSNITARAKHDYEELKAEFESHKKYALDRYAKLNAELHHTRMELKRK